MPVAIDGNEKYIKKSMVTGPNLASPHRQAMGCTLADGHLPQPGEEEEAP